MQYDVSEFREKIVKVDKKKEPRKDSRKRASNKGEGAQELLAMNHVLLVLVRVQKVSLRE